MGLFAAGFEACFRACFEGRKSAEMSWRGGAAGDIAV